MGSSDFTSEQRAANRAAHAWIEARTCNAPALTRERFREAAQVVLMFADALDAETRESIRALVAIGEREQEDDGSTYEDWEVEIYG